MATAAGADHLLDAHVFRRADEQQTQAATAASGTADALDKRLYTRVGPEDEDEQPSLQSPRLLADGVDDAMDAASLRNELAHALTELADARDSARLAARAGTALLERLARAEADGDALREELARSERDKARLERVVCAMDDQLRSFELAETPARRHSAHAAPGSWRPANACEACEDRRRDARAARQERDQLRRERAELELQALSACETERELRGELERASDRARRVQSELAAVTRDREGLTEQLEVLQEENARLGGVRETLRAAMDSLRADKHALGDRIGALERQVEALAGDKRELVTRAQIAENRRFRAESDYERLLQTVDELSRARGVEECETDKQSEAADDEAVHCDQERARDVSAGDGEWTTAAELLRLDVSRSGAPAPLPSPRSASEIRGRPQLAQWALSLPLGVGPVTAPTSAPVTPLAVAAGRAAAARRISGVDAPAGSMPSTSVGLSLLVACATAAGIAARR